MDWRSAFTAFVWLATAGLFVLRIAMGQDVVRSAGYALAPWLIGLVVALIKMVVMRKRTGFRDSVEGAAFVLLLILYVTTLLRM
jgi:hypothetical protein